MDLVGAKIIEICSEEFDTTNSIFADKLILEKDGENFLVERSHNHILNICKIIIGE